MAQQVRTIESLHTPLTARLQGSTQLQSVPLPHANGELPCYQFLGPQHGADTIRIGIFAGIHGDEPATASACIKFLELLDEGPDLARDFLLHVYPVCNPSGYKLNTRESASGKDLNREFWKSSAEPEVRILEEELTKNGFNGIISLHADDTTPGIYGFVSGATLTQSLLEPALKAAELFLPRNERPIIDGFAAEKGIIREGYRGILSAPPNAHPRPFELIFETPHLAPFALQEQAFIVALLSILAEYRKTISYAADL